MRVIPALAEKEEWTNDSIAVGTDSQLIKRHYEDLVAHYFKPITRQWSNPLIRFYNLKEQWLNDTFFSSSITEIAMHPAYQQIIGMGPLAVPFILLEMMERPGQWFWALKSITGEDPVPPEERGQVKRMTEYWITWGKEQKYLS